jgi:hypothetical protein
LLLLLPLGSFFFVLPHLLSETNKKVIPTPLQPPQIQQEEEEEDV